MIIDLTGSSLKTPQADIEFECAGEWRDNTVDWVAVAEWGEFRDERMQTYSRDAAIEVIKSALLSTGHMQDILIRACPREIRSRVADIINDLNISSVRKVSEPLPTVRTRPVAPAAERIVDLNQQLVKDRKARDNEQ